MSQSSVNFEGRFLIKKFLAVVILVTTYGAQRRLEKYDVRVEQCRVRIKIDVFKIISRERKPDRENPTFGHLRIHIKTPTLHFRARFQSEPREIEAIARNFENDGGSLKIDDPSAPRHVRSGRIRAGCAGCD